MNNSNVGLKEVMEVQSYSYQTKRMRKFISRKLRLIPGVSFYQDDGNIYATKGKADVFPCAVSHTDTVHRIINKYEVSEYGGAMYAWTKEKGGAYKQTGIGGDDKVGIYICLRLLETQPVIKCAFFRDEEVGCIGSAAHDKSFFKDVGYVMQADRRGAKDITSTINYTEMVSDDFKKAVAPVIQKHGRIWVDGMMTDVEELARTHKVSMFNASCGYYNPHTSNEYIVISEVEATFQMFAEMISHLGYATYPCLHEDRWNVVRESYYERRMAGYGWVYDGDDLFDNKANIQTKQTPVDAQGKRVLCPLCYQTNNDYDETLMDYYCYGCGAYFEEIIEDFQLKDNGLVYD